MNFNKISEISEAEPLTAESRSQDGMATGATKSQIISGCYERFVLGHEAAPSGSDDPDAAAAFSWTQRFAVKAHQGPVKCVKVCSRPPPDSVSLSLSSGPSACDLALTRSV